MKGWDYAHMASLPIAQTDADAVQETLLGEALEHAPVGAIVLDEDGRYLAANRMACRLTGYDRGELLELGPADLAVEPARVSEKLRQMASGELEHGATSVRCKDGGVMPVEYRVGATRSGGLPYFVLVFWKRET
jgi:PAS domain S-box-containing protein